MKSYKYARLSPIAVATLLALQGCGSLPEVSTHSSSLAALTKSCPQPIAEATLPQLPSQTRGRFEHWQNRLLVETLKRPPYHFAKDLVIHSGAEGTMQAKFDYGSLVHKDLEGEWVDAFLLSQQEQQWQPLGSFKTDSDGKVFVAINGLELGEYVVQFRVQGDGSRASGRISVVAEAEQSVVFDLDSTLTLSDFNVVEDYLKGTTAPTRKSAVELANLYAAKGYRIIYLTVRPYILVPITQSWIRQLGLPRGHLYSPISFEQSLDIDQHAPFKSAYLSYLVDDLGLDIVAAYGNSASDIKAYESVGIAKDKTFIVGEQGGTKGTIDLGEDFREHLVDLEKRLIDASCQL